LWNIRCGGGIPLAFSFLAPGQLAQFLEQGIEQETQATIADWQHAAVDFATGTAR
jgi:hypothetical protein